MDSVDFNNNEHLVHHKRVQAKLGDSDAKHYKSHFCDKFV